jgi:thiosulfate/3-mercaptopyruvate sulfurtransferase
VTGGPGPLVSVEWLREHLDDPDLRIVHVSLDRATYDERHIPGAVFSDLHEDLALRGTGPGTGDAARAYLVPDAEHGRHVLQRWGVGEGSRVVFYDDAGQNRHAIRGLWLLRLYGWPRDSVHVLEGGLNRWVSSGGATTDEVGPVPSVEPVALGAGEPSVLATFEQVREWTRESAGGGPIRILDVRTAEEFVGDDLQARRGGHMPGAANLEWRRFLNPDDTFRSPDEIRALAAEAIGGDPGQLRAAHCQGGIRAALAWFALSELGGLPVANYAGSWEEWGNRDDTPIER